ncbi:MAG: phosphoribosylanthranilate isomerase [Chloroflexota bacterium]
MTPQTKIKICGLTNFADAQVAVEAGADMLGFIFFKPSPRYVAPETVKDIVATIKSQVPTPPRFVGVFVNESLDFVAETVAKCDLDLAQLHGEEKVEFIDAFSGQAFKACNPRSLAEAEAAATTFLTQTTAPFIMMDAYHPQLRGGTGHTGDWAVAAQIAQDHDLLLAGGLTPDNVATAIEQVNPWGVDVASGVEARKGKKDHGKVRAFIQAARG